MSKDLTLLPGPKEFSLVEVSRSETTLWTRRFLVTGYAPECLPDITTRVLSVTRSK